MREIDENLKALKPNGRAAKRLTKELASAGIPPHTPAKPHAERDDNGNVIRPFPVGRAARRRVMNGVGREKLSRSRVQRITRKRRIGGVQ